MFPWNYGFAWDKGHIIFLGVFYTVVLVVLTTLLIAAWRTLRDFRRNRAASIVWHENFEDLPRAERSCRHDCTGEMPGRVCELGFNCGQCETHAKFVSILARHHAEPALLPDLVDDSLGFPGPARSLLSPRPHLAETRSRRHFHDRAGRTGAARCCQSEID